MSSNERPPNDADRGVPDDVDYDVIIIGAGFSGLGMAIALKKSGAYSFVVLEKGDGVGGTWRDNVYPGCACDVPSHLYCYSFAPNPKWSRLFAPQEEIRQYLERCATRFGVRDRIRFGQDVKEARYMAEQQRWQVTAASGQVMTARSVVSGQGALHIPQVPSIEGQETFEGEQMHSARWPQGAALRGRRVAVIGTGASAIQLVPKIVEDVESLVVFQRHAPWIEPKPDWRISSFVQRCFERIPALSELFRGLLYQVLERRVVPLLGGGRGSRNERKALAHLARQVPDQRLRILLTPAEQYGCKRILLSNDYYPVFGRSNVALETAAIQRITPQAIETANQRHEVDTIVWCTGFQVTDYRANPLKIFGRGGRSLNEEMSETAKAYLGISTEGYPNFFWLMGPHTGLGHNSMVYMIECQIQHIMGVLELMRKAGATSIEVSLDAQNRFENEMDDKMAGTVWMSGCTAWYQDASGRISTLWPDHTYVYRRRTRTVSTEDYVVTVPPVPGVSAP